MFILHDAYVFTEYVYMIYAIARGKEIAIIYYLLNGNSRMKRMHALDYSVKVICQDLARGKSTFLLFALSLQLWNFKTSLLVFCVYFFS